MMTDENTYTDAQGVRYFAKTAGRLQNFDAPACRGCAFWPKGDFANCEISKCCEEQRIDNRNIIWIKESP